MKRNQLLSVLLAGTMLAGTSLSAFAETIPGDILVDGVVNVADAVLLARVAASDKTVDLTQIGASDLNGDGVTTADDVTLLLQFLGKKIPSLPSGTIQQQYQTVNLTDTVTTQTVQQVPLSEAFVQSQIDFAAKLLQQTMLENKTHGNLLISPLSVSQALAMTANGAKNETRAEMEQLLGGDIPLEDLNTYYYSYIQSLPNTEKSALYPANSIWVRNQKNRIQVPAEFLQTTKDYYDADAFLAPFDQSTVDDINTWVSDKTHGMINNPINKIYDETLMFLINALAFEAEWAKPYASYSISSGRFTAYDGSEQEAEMMHSTEYQYLSADGATGFVKYYADRGYSFAAVLPPEDIAITDYIATLDGTALSKLLNSRSNYETVITAMPKFSFDYGTSLKNTLETLGMTTPFQEHRADFTGLNTIGDTWIGDVVHKTHITVDEVGTKAGAVTIVVMPGNAMPMEQKEVILDRPFLFMILDEAYQLPIFIGTVTTLE